MSKARPRHGVKCGHCKGRHDTVAQARLCSRRYYDERAQAEADAAAARAEAEMEARAERFWEEGPHGPEPEDPREIEAQMRDDQRRDEANRAMGRTRRQRPF